MVDYEHFLNQVRQKEAAPLMNNLKSFLAQFTSERRPVTQQRKSVVQFLQFIYAESLQNPIFAEASDDAELENIREGWEKLVMMKLYDTVFGAPGTDEAKMNAQLQRKLEAFRWVQEQHLDLPFELGHTLEVAQAELLRINGFRAPRDKLTILQNTNQLLVGLIQKDAGENAGNDHLLPALILCIIRSNPPNLISNIKNQAELDKGPVQYTLTNMMGAVSYIFNLSTKSLTLTDEERAMYARELPTQDTTATSPEIGQFASKVYGTTSSWFSNFLKEAKVFTEQAAESVGVAAEGLVSQLTGSSDEENAGSTNAGSGSNNARRARSPPPPLPPRGSSNAYPGAAGTGATRSSTGDLLQTGDGAPVQVFTPVGATGPSPVQGSLPNRGNLSAQQRAELEDYELQLALALSLSSMEEQGKQTPQADGFAEVGGVEEEEEPLLTRGKTGEAKPVSSPSSSTQPRIVVLISGNGSNLQAIIDAIKAGSLNARIALVLSNKKAAYGLTRASEANIPTAVLTLKSFRDAGKSRTDYDIATADLIKERLAADAAKNGSNPATPPNLPDLIVLAGWMHILSPAFLAQFPTGRVINLHPALPGAFDGAHAIDRAFQAFKEGKIKETGVMVHKVIPEVDRGEVILQEAVPIFEDDTLEALEQRIHGVEHRLIVEGTKVMVQSTVAEGALVDLL
ncbi:hypothetical protein HK104_008448 [Borealophlyctis nickersoniae]|nr:hypothetical protein HK104_008448 [Borealophlyctis nickersoniae]